MLKMEDLLHGANIGDQSLEIIDNLTDLLSKVQGVEAECPIKGWLATSGLRTMERHLRIYRDLAARKRRPFEDGVFDESKVPKSSKHLNGTAVDIADPGLKITKWLKTPEGAALLDKYDLYCEEGNADWVHFQTKKFGSYKPGGSRWFNP